MSALCKLLRWTLAVAIALALQAGLSVTAEAMGTTAFSHVSAAATNPIPHPCLQRNVSAEAQARCDLILRGLCLRPNLSKNIQLLCDQQRFADVPLYDVVRVAFDGTIRSIHLIETATGRTVYTAYPYGIAFAIPAKRDRVLRMRVEDLKAFVDQQVTLGAGSKWRGSAARRNTASPAASGPTGYATGLPIGWNPSTGITSGQCFNYTIQTPSGNVEQESFTSQNAASSTAEQINLTSTVSGAYDGFKASDTFTYSDQWQSSANSSNQYFNAYSLYTLNPTVDSLNATGTAALNNDTFNTLCGSKYLESVPVGMAITISVNYGSTSSSTQEDISNQFKGNYTLASITNAVSKANTETDSTSYFTFTMISYGGGSEASTTLNAAFATQDPSNGVAYYEECATGNTEGCKSFESSIGGGAATALGSLTTQVDNLARNPDLNFMETFPNGVVGAVTPALVTAPIPNTSSTDILAKYKTQLNDYLSLVNQIVTLNNRVSTDIGMTSSLYYKVQQDNFNPATFFPVAAYLEELANTYQSDFQPLMDNLQSCLSTSALGLKENCAAVIDNYNNNLDTAYSWYGARSGSQYFAAQQNAIALQYAGLFTNNNGSSWPQDVFYAPELAFGSGYNYFPLIAGQGGLVSFADSPYVNAGETETTASLTFLPLMANTDLSKMPDSVYIPSADQGVTAPGVWWSFFDNQPGPATDDPSEAPTWLGLSSTCSPTFSFPCPIGYGLQSSSSPDYPLSIQMTQIPNFFTSN